MSSYTIRIPSVAFVLVACGGTTATGDAGGAGDALVDASIGPVVQLACAYKTACALGSAGGVRCWGNPLGEPLPQVPLRTIDAHGGGLVCGLTTSGAVCWVVTPIPSKTRPPVPTGAFSSVASGVAHACGLRPDGVGECWSDNDLDTWAPPPPNLTFSEIVAGYYSTCAIRSDNAQATCWHQDLGAPPPTDALLHVAVGGNFACGIRRLDRSLVCWGSFGLPSPPPGAFVAVQAAWGSACAQRVDGTIICFSDPILIGSTPTSSFQNFCVGNAYACAVDYSSKVVCWGLNDQGQSSPPPL